VAGFFWWRWHQQKKGVGKAKGGRSPFRFPGVAAGTGKTKTLGAPTPVASTAASSLPRNKASNNKKNKARRKDEKKAKQTEKEQRYVVKTTENFANQLRNFHKIIMYRISNFIS
jgi:hypothetical protein